MAKIKVHKPLVVLHGDEMAQIAFERILEQFVHRQLDIQLVEIDLTAENRLLTNGDAVRDAIDALKRHGVGIKNAGMTVNRDQLDELLAKHPHIDEAGLDRLATKSPNGAIRKGISGNITREDIQFRNIEVKRPQWIGRDIEVSTMDQGGIKDSSNQLSEVSGCLQLQFISADGEKRSLHQRLIKKGDPWLLSSNTIEDVRQWAHGFYKRALAEGRDAYLGLKDTVIPGYDGVMRAAIEEIFERDYQQQFANAGLEYHYELIDAQAARIVANPPERALWGVPDNNTGRKLYKLVEQMKVHGIAGREAHVSISRMSAGGGDQYGSYNAAMSERGLIRLLLDDTELASREVSAGDPVLLMTNDRQAIRDWVKQVFSDASVNNKEVYFGLKREYMEYDDVFSDVIADVRRELAQEDKPPPSFMIMRPSSQLIKMITDPPRTALYPAQNLDGDIFSDISAALGGSLATASSVIESKDGTMLFEAPHGTAHDLYLRYLKSGGKEALFNSSALLFAVANALATLAAREGNGELQAYARKLKQALIDTVDAGIITGDLKGKTRTPEKEQIVDMFGFLDAIESRL